MIRACVLLSLTTVLFAGSAFSQSAPAGQTSRTNVATIDTTPSKSTSGNAAAQAANKKQTKAAGPKKPLFSAYHQGPWEEQIGYSQAVQAGRTIYISGTVGANEKGFPSDMESQMILAYAAIRKTMDHYGANFSNVVREHIYTTDLEELKKCQDARKKIYGDWLPAATWVEVKRLYSAEAKLEIEVELEVN